MDNSERQEPSEVSKSHDAKKKGSSEGVSHSERNHAMRTSSQSLKEKGVVKKHDSDSEWDEDYLHYLNSKDFKRHNQEA